jgi:thymidine kinase
VENILADNDIVVITGPMKCGKTKQLIEFYNQYKDTHSCMVFKPEIDNRFSENEVVSRDDDRAKSYNLRKLTDLKEYDFNCDIFFIDEFQFITGDIEIILNLVDIGKKFVISGLNLTSDRKPFGIMPQLLSCADKVIIKTAKCDICDKPAKFTFCDVQKNQDVLVGDNQYKSVCKECYNKLRR